KSKFLQVYQELTADGQPPTIGQLAEKLSISKNSVRHYLSKLKLIPRYIPEARYKSFGLYRDGLTKDIPSDAVVTLRRNNQGVLWISVSRLSIGGLPEDIGVPGDKILVHFKRVK